MKFVEQQFGKVNDSMLSRFQFLKKKDQADTNEINAITEQQVDEEEQNNANEEEKNEPESQSLFHIPSSIKNNKAVMDLIVSTEQIAHQHQMSEHRYIELQNRYKHTSEQLSERIKEVNRLNKIIESKESRIDTLEKKITDKNLQLDQHMEDYKEMQFSLTNEIEELKNIINVENKKYQSFNEQYEKETLDWVNKLKKKEDIILKLESENANYKEQNEHIRKENEYLMSMASDFTNRMSASFLDYKRDKRNE
ncbi:hypothetical protein MHB40_01170 [Lysinibacillus sp. FSL K6-0057]|uniref:hypothetical protein n=1 Tax=unclassified Lysinibacillus TaxID=2636778 RepID=UPI00315973DD